MHDPELAEGEEEVGRVRRLYVLTDVVVGQWQEEHQDRRVELVVLGRVVAGRQGRHRDMSF